MARHLSNIFTKLDVTSRTAAAAYAHEQGCCRDAWSTGPVKVPQQSDLGSVVDDLAVDMQDECRQR